MGNATRNINTIKSRIIKTPIPIKTSISKDVVEEVIEKAIERVVEKVVEKDMAAIEKVGKSKTIKRGRPKEEK